MYIDHRSYSMRAPDGAKCQASHLAPDGAQAVSQSGYYIHIAPPGLWAHNPEDRLYIYESNQVHECASLTTKRDQWIYFRRPPRREPAGQQRN
jgi:hypothetical protein